MRRLLQSLTGNVKKKVNAPDDEKVSPLHYAARYNYQSICKLLVEAGAGEETFYLQFIVLFFFIRKRYSILTYVRACVRACTYCCVYVCILADQLKEIFMETVPAPYVSFDMSLSFSLSFEFEF